MNFKPLELTMCKNNCKQKILEMSTRHFSGLTAEGAINLSKVGSFFDLFFLNTVDTILLATFKNI